MAEEHISIAHGFRPQCGDGPEGEGRGRDWVEVGKRGRKWGTSVIVIRTNEKYFRKKEINIFFFIIKM